jgi:RNA polymerase sigma factor (sigma-70 family)
MALAAKSYESDRGVPFVNFVSRKGMYMAIDEMRKDGVLRRRRNTPGPKMTALTPELPDPHGERGHSKLETYDLVGALMSRLRDQDRQLLMMYYADDLTFREIAKVFNISESAVCLRHKALMQKLQKMANRKTMS